MVQTDWYRNNIWDDDIEAQFLDKLNHSRSQRDQYFVIQASTLSDERPDVTLLLIKKYFESKSDDFHDFQAHQAKAKAYMALGNFEKAIKTYKDVLNRESEYPQHQTNTYIEPPYLIASLELPEYYGLAEGLLNQGVRDISFPVDYFMFHSACALIVCASGKGEFAKSQANEAIQAAGVRKSGIRYHQSIGLVGERHFEVLNKICALAER